MADIIISDLFDRIKPYIYGLIQEVSQAQAESGLAVHDLDGSFHIGTLDISRVPDALNRSGGTLLGNINAMDGVLIDGVDISVFNQQFTTHASLDAVTAHGSVGIHTHADNAEGGLISHTVLDDRNTGDPHTNLVHNSIARNITAQHIFSPSSPSVPFYLSANAQDQLVTGLYADSVNKNVYPGNGLSAAFGQTLLDADITLSVEPGYGISVDGSGTNVDNNASFDWYGTHSFNQTTTMVDLYSYHHIPRLTDTYDLGTSTVLWRKGWLSELDTIIFAQNTVTLLGGWLLITKGEGSWDSDLPADNVSFNYNFGTLPIALNDFLLCRATGKVEYFQVSAFVSGTTWTVTRNKDGSGGNAWPAGTPFAILGNNGNGRIELNAYDSPRIQIIKQGTDYNLQTEILRMGDLNGNWGINTETFGFAAGEYAAGKPNMLLDATGLRLRIFTTEYITLDNTGAYIAGVLTLGTNGGIFQGTGTFASPTTGLKMYRSGSVGLLEGYSGGTMQARFNASGEIEGGGGIIKINSSGISAAATTSRADIRSYKFLSGTTNIGGVVGWSAFNANTVQVEALDVSGNSSAVVIDARGSTAAKDAAVQINAVHGGMRIGLIDVRATDTTSSIGITATRISLNGMLEFGSTVFPASPSTNYLQYRTDFRALFSYDGTTWRQVSTGQFTGSFPSSPIDNLRVYRIDRDLEYFYNSATSQWLTTTVFYAPVGDQRINAPWTSANIGTTDTFVTVWHVDTSQYAVRIINSYFTAILTNATDVSNYWTIRVDVGSNTVSATSNLLAESNITGAANSATKFSITDATVAQHANGSRVALILKRVLSPAGTLTVRGQISYRMVG